MNRNRILMAIGIAFLVGLFASRYVYRQLQQAAANKPVKTDQVVVAAAPLPLGTRLQAGQLRVLPWPVGAQPPGSFSRLEDCVGRAIIASVVPNEPILEARLAPKEAGSGLPVAIPEGKRAVSVRVDDVVAVAGFTMPGTMVDVLVTGELQTGSGNSITRTVLEDVRVLAAGQQVQQDEKGKPQTLTVVTLLVDPEQANLLTMASTEGKIHLSLRNTIDSQEVHPAAVLRSALFSPGLPEHPAVRGHAAVVKPTPKNYVVEVIRAGKREDQSFPATAGDPR
jgi:pilus assembly protein CpaB